MDIYQVCRIGDLDFLKQSLTKAEQRLGLPKLVQYLNRQNIFGRTPLHYCCRFGHTECARYLIEKYNVRLDITNKNNWNILHDAARWGHSDTTKYIISLKETHYQTITKLLTQQTIYGSTPLHLACRKGDLEVIKLLFAVSNLNQTNDRNQNILHIAAESGHVHVLEWFLQQPNIALMFTFFDKRKATPIQYVACIENDEGLEVLKKIFQRLGNSARGLVSYKDAFGNNALHYAVYANSFKTIEFLSEEYENQLLLENKTVRAYSIHPLLARNKRGKTPLDLCSHKMQEKIKNSKLAKYLEDNTESVQIEFL